MQGQPMWLALLAGSNSDYPCVISQALLVSNSICSQIYVAGYRLDRGQPVDYPWKGLEKPWNAPKSHGLPVDRGIFEGSPETTRSGTCFVWGPVRI